MKKTHKTKRSYLVDKKFQLGSALIIAAVQIPCILVTGIILSWFYLIYMDRQMSAPGSTAIFWVMVLLCALLTLLTAVITVRRTHSVAGPAKKISTLLRQITRGPLPEEQILFRKHDSFLFLADDLNRLILRVKKDRQALAAARECLDYLKRETRGLDSHELNRHLENLEQALSETNDRALENN
jgi:hypothetical protein